MSHGQPPPQPRGDWYDGCQHCGLKPPAHDRETGRCPPDSKTPEQTYEHMVKAYIWQEIFEMWDHVT